MRRGLLRVVCLQIKNDMQNIPEKEVPRFPKSELEFAKTLEGQVQKQINKAIQGGAVIEAAILSWATIEQIFIPRLVKFVARNLKLKLPEKIFEAKTSTLIEYYFCLSHDEILYNLLVEANKTRNRLIHRLYKEEDLKRINNLALRFTERNIRDLYKGFIDRFSGSVDIPSLKLYSQGWNDCRNETIKRISGLLES